VAQALARASGQPVHDLEPQVIATTLISAMMTAARRRHAYGYHTHIGDDFEHALAIGERGLRTSHTSRAPANLSNNPPNAGWSTAVQPVIATEGKHRSGGPTHLRAPGLTVASVSLARALVLRWFATQVDDPSPRGRATAGRLSRRSPRHGGSVRTCRPSRWHTLPDSRSRTPWLRSRPSPRSGPEPNLGKMGRPGSSVRFSGHGT
jgi:hypothetical protein